MAVASAFRPMAIPAKAPATSLTCRARAVPIPCEAVPMASPRAGQSRMRRRFRSGGPSEAPRTPVNTTRTAVSEGSPPSSRLIAMATGAVTDFGAMEMTVTWLPPRPQTIAAALADAVSEPARLLATMAPAEWRSRASWR